MGNLNSRTRNNGLIKSWWTHVQSRGTHTQKTESRPKQNACADSDTLSFTQIPAVCGAQSEVLGAGTGRCRLFVPQSHQSHLKTHSLLRTPALPRRKTATHKGSQLGTTHACVWGYIGVCLCLCHGKTITSASMRPVCLCGLILQKSDQRLLVNPPGWLGRKVENVPQSRDSQGFEPLLRTIASLRLLGGA